MRTKFSNAIGLRSPIRYDDLVVVLQKGQNYTCEIDGTGHFESWYSSWRVPAHYTRIIHDYRFSPASVSVEEGSITSLHLLSGKWNKPYPCNSYENFYRLLFPLLVSAQSFVITQHTSLSISYDPIALIRVQAPTTAVATTPLLKRVKDFLVVVKVLGK